MLIEKLLKNVDVSDKKFVMGHFRHVQVVLALSFSMSFTVSLSIAISQMAFMHELYDDILFYAVCTISASYVVDFMTHSLAPFLTWVFDRDRHVITMIAYERVSTLLFLLKNLPLHLLTLGMPYIIELGFNSKKILLLAVPVAPVLVILSMTGIRNSYDDILSKIDEAIPGDAGIFDDV